MSNEKIEIRCWRAITDEPLAIAIGFKPEGPFEIEPITIDEARTEICETDILEWHTQKDADEWAEEWAE
jgi:hypothetical protein